MAGVIAEGDGGAIGRPHSSLRADDQILLPQQVLRLPAHAGRLGEAKQVAAGPGFEDFIRQRQFPARTLGARLNLIDSSIRF